jgi:hypothetical protein
MATFNEAVKKAKGEVGKDIPKPVKWKGIKCVPITGSYEDNFATWPTHFLIPPQVGDFVVNESGGRLQIISITHRIGGVSIELGREKSSDVTPTEGGSSGGGYT